MRHLHPADSCSAQAAVTCCDFNLLSDKFTFAMSESQQHQRDPHLQVIMGFASRAHLLDMLSTALTDMRAVQAACQTARRTRGIPWGPGNL